MGAVGLRCRSLVVRFWVPCAGFRCDSLCWMLACGSILAFGVSLNFRCASILDVVTFQASWRWVLCDFIVASWADSPFIAVSLRRAVFAVVLVDLTSHEAVEVVWFTVCCRSDPSC